MKWFVFLVVFSTVLAGFLTPTLAFALEGEHDQAHESTGNAPADHSNDHSAKLSVGVKQPDAIRAKAVLPSKIVLLDPQPLSKVSGSSVTLKWKPSVGATVYHVQVATDPRFKWMVTENWEVSGESFEVSNLQAGQQYFWRVAGRAPDNDASWTKGFFSASSFVAK